MFCCDSGYCLSSQLVCDGKPDCDDSSEEAHCELIIFPQAYNYSFDKPPVRLRRKKNITYIKPLDVELDLTILLMKFIMRLKYHCCWTLDLTWYDHHLHFKYLKENSEKNQFRSHHLLLQKPWIPTLLFYIENEDKSEKYEDKLTVMRRSDPSLVPRDKDPIVYFSETQRRRNSELDFDEVYAGEMNPIRLTTEKRKVFSSSFNNINSYPFGDQWCSFTLLIVLQMKKQICC